MDADSGHSHPDNGSFIIWANGTYLTGDTGYAGLPQALHHNTITVGGVGQGVEGQHDVWRKMTPTVLDGIRITSVTRQGGALRIESEVAAAYPADAGLERFTRAFTIDKGQFTVEDSIALSSAKPIQWYFQSDAPIGRDGTAFVLGGRPGVRLSHDATLVEATVAPTILMAPGQPGSITKGVEESRGFHVKLESKPVTTIRLKTVLSVKQ